MIKKYLQKIHIMQREMERSMLSINLKDSDRNQVIKSWTEVRDAVEFSLQLKWNWQDMLNE